MFRFKRSVFIILASCFLLPTLVQAIKPRPPVQLMFQEKALSETEVAIILTARSNIETSSLSLTLTLPAYLSLIEGETEWEGALSAGEEQIMRVIILKPGGQGTEIEGRAMIRLPNDLVFEQTNRLILKKSRQQSEKAIPPMKQKGKSGGILEFR